MNSCFNFLPNEMIRFQEEELIIVILLCVVMTCRKFRIKVLPPECRQFPQRELRWEFNTVKNKTSPSTKEMTSQSWFVLLEMVPLPKEKWLKHFKWQSLKNFRYFILFRIMSGTSLRALKKSAPWMR